jgi:hypothetical protein
LTNVREGGRLETGVILGSASDDGGVAAVEVQVDGGDWAAATGTDA